MKCSKCKTDNAIKANYCKKCANKFTKKEQDAAYQKTVYGKIDLFEKWFNRFTLAVILDHWLFKTVVTLGILALGILFCIKNGTHLKVLENEMYDLYYMEKTKEYYLVAKENQNEIPLDLFIPNRTETIEVNHYNNNDELLSKEEYKKDGEIVLETYSDDYYILVANYKGDKKENLKIFSYRANDIEIVE